MRSDENGETEGRLKRLTDLVEPKVVKIPSRYVGLASYIHTKLSRTLLSLLGMLRPSRLGRVSLHEMFFAADDSPEQTTVKR